MWHTSERSPAVSSACTQAAGCAQQHSLHALDACFQHHTAPPVQGRTPHGAAAREQPARGRLWGGCGPAERLSLQLARGVLGPPGALRPAGACFMQACLARATWEGQAQAGGRCLVGVCSLGISPAQHIVPLRPSLDRCLACPASARALAPPPRPGTWEWSPWPAWRPRVRASVPPACSLLWHALVSAAASCCFLWRIRRAHPASLRSPPAARPAGLLQDRAAAAGLARLLDPLVRAVDGLVGEKVAMLVEVEYPSEPLLACLHSSFTFSACLPLGHLHTACRLRCAALHALQAYTPAPALTAHPLAPTTLARPHAVALPHLLQTRRWLRASTSTSTCPPLWAPPPPPLRAACWRGRRRCGAGDGLPGAAGRC